MKLESKKDRVDKKNNRPHGAYIFKVSSLDTEGNGIEGAQIMMLVAGKHIETKKANGRSNPKSKDWSASFEYVPKGKGKKEITFESEGKTIFKDITVL